MMKTSAIAAASALFLGAVLAAAVPAVTASASVTPETFTYPSNFEAVSAASSSDAWAVGSADINYNDWYGLAEHWNGKAWTKVPVPGTGEYNDNLVGVSAYSPTDAWAVGQVGTQAVGLSSQVIHWNGKAWSQVAAPVRGPDGYAYILTGISVASPDSVWAVGYGGDTSDGIVLHWNGKAWSWSHILGQGDQLLAVTALSPSNVWAVGALYKVSAAGEGDYTVLPLVMHWNGKAWSSVSAPALRGTGTGLDFMDEEGLTAVSSSSSGLWVTGGFTESGSNAITAYAARLTGKKWTLFRLPEQVLYANPKSVAASRSGAWIAGNYGSPDQAAHWNGKKWSPALIGKIDPDSDPEAPLISGLAAVSPSSAWAVGCYTTPAHFSTCIAGVYHWNGKTWALSS